MNTNKFQSLIQAITGRPLIIHAGDEIATNSQYVVMHTLPITGISVRFYWKTAKTEEKMLKSFITAFCSKYREPDPAKYDYEYGGKAYTWAEMTEEKREYAHLNHTSKMYAKERLMEQIQANFERPEMEDALIRYGFYPTEYGLGIYVLYATKYTRQAVDRMAAYLKDQGIPYTNEHSDAGWVLRFRLGIDRRSHENLLKSFAA